MSGKYTMTFDELHPTAEEIFNLAYDMGYEKGVEDTLKRQEINKDIEQARVEGYEEGYRRGWSGANHFVGEMYLNDRFPKHYPKVEK